MGGLYMVEVWKAMSSSSLKGVPRIISARGGVQRTVWTGAVSGFFVVCMLTVTFNIRAYLQYPKVVTVDEKLMQHTDPNGTVPFPSITVCNLNPFSSNKGVFEQYGIPSLHEYFSRMDEVTACFPNCSAHTRQRAELVRTVLMTARGYYQYVGRENMLKIQNYHFIQFCQAVEQYGSTLMSYPCHKLTTNYTFLHPDAGLCYTFDVKPSNNRKVVGYKFNFHLDSSSDDMNTEYAHEFLPAPSTGVAVYATDPYSVPNLLGTGLTRAQSGRVTTVYIKAVRTDRLSRPYSERECIDGNEYDKIPAFNKLFNYDIMSCQSKCAVEYVIGKCNCTDMWLAMNPEDRTPAVDYCWSLKQPTSVLFDKAMCTERHKGDAFMACALKCKEPCREVRYKLQTTVANWPVSSQLASFYKNIIDKSADLRKRFRKYLETGKAIGDVNANVSDIDRLLAARAVEENFAVGTIYMYDPYYTHYESKPKFTVDALISQLGGSFNFWSGITVYIIVELVDFLIALCKVNSLKRNARQDSIRLKRNQDVSNPKLSESLSKGSFSSDR